MAFRLSHTFAASALALILVATVQAAPNIHTLTSAPVKTLQLSSEIVTENQDELKKIDGDIALAYRLHRGAMVYEQPGKLRIDASIPHLATGYYIINGNQKLTVAPFFPHKVQDTTGAPGKRQTLLDFGLVPPELLTDYNATYLRRESGLLVFQLQPKQAGETQKDLVWIDPKTHITTQRYNYNRDGKLTKWFLYKNPKLVGGVYVPTRIELYNPENKLAGATVYENIRVNAPVSESLFKI